MTLIEELVHLLATEWQPVQTSESSLARVRGMLKPTGFIPSEHQLREAYIDYLIEKFD